MKETMQKTLKNFIEYSSINAELIRAVVRQSGGWQSFQEIAPDIANHGITSGFSGWTYYSETCRFYAKNRGTIVALAEEYADEFNLSPIGLVAGFNCLDADNKSNVGRTLYGNKRQHAPIVAKSLAWFAAEEVARSFVDWIEQC